MKNKLAVNQLVRVLTGTTDYITTIHEVTKHSYIVDIEGQLYSVLPSQVHPVKAAPTGDRTK